ncbi:hypothetical protein GYH30_052518 [Glycine max]|nr:hypothetical protein GYH30_052518 [Glycine max]
MCRLWRRVRGGEGVAVLRGLWDKGEKQGAELSELDAEEEDATEEEGFRRQRQWQRLLVSAGEG